MPTRHYQGPGLEGEQLTGRLGGHATPQPPKGAPLTVIPGQSIVYDTAAVAVPAFHVTIVEQSAQETVTIIGAGVTLDEAIAQARLKFEEAQPVQPLIWGNGQPLDGLAHEVLVNALSTYRDYLGVTAPANVIVILGRLQASLGEDPS